MQLVEQRFAAAHAVTGVEETAVDIGSQRFEGTVLVSDQCPPQLLAITLPEQLNVDALAPLLASQCRLLLVGCRPVRLLLEHRKQLSQQGMALETMDRRAACRTYNVLLAEGRSVALLVFPPESG